ncbi:uncharacterized protein [Ptychodera flava]|uniref:uncharacterized protein n=1 Tax=Ptychodera flava TaxID=63121 RepID=UPI00396A8FBB
MDVRRCFRSSLLMPLLATVICSAQKYPVTVQHGEETYEGVVEVNVDKGEEIYRTGYTIPEDGAKPKTGSEAPYIVRDVNKKIDAIVDEHKGVCYLSAYDADEEVSPVDLKKDMEASKEEKSDKGTIVDKQEIEVKEPPIKDVAAISPLVESHCLDKLSYWTIVTEENKTCDGAPCEDEQSELDTRGVKLCLRWTYKWDFQWQWQCSKSCVRVLVRVRVRMCATYYYG